MATQPPEKRPPDSDDTKERTAAGAREREERRSHDDERASQEVARALETIDEAGKGIVEDELDDEPTARKG